MRSSRARAVFVFSLLGACGGASREDSPAREGSAAAVTTVATSATDPITHLNVIASPAMEGRGTGTPGHQRASDYIADQARAAGLAGAFPGTAKPYHQPFSVGGWPFAPGSDSRGDHDHGPEVGEDEEFGSELFEHGLYVSGDASPETRREMGAKLCATWTAALPCPASAEDPREHVVRASATANVVAILPGTGAHRSEIVLLTAHLDHLGSSWSGVYPGADDNGSGSSALVAIMHQIAEARATRPVDRTIAFLWTSGEEKGLLGAAYFVDNPPPAIPLPRIKQVVNLDMVGRWDDTRMSIGEDRNAASKTFTRALEAENQRLERPFARINKDIQSYERRQDGWAFSRRAVPSVFLFEGLSRPEGGGGMMPHYHRTSDTIDAMMRENGGSKLRRVSDLVAKTVIVFANAP
jgi:aminopeptidase YwaD